MRRQSPANTANRQPIAPWWAIFHAPTSALQSNLSFPFPPKSLCQCAHSLRNPTHEPHELVVLFP
jgi:hypothetical protein